MHPLRQEYEQALLRALDDRRNKPALGICLGMQMMSLHHGATYDQCLSETLPTHSQHKSDTQHAIQPLSLNPGPAGAIPAGFAASNHSQAVTHAGRLRAIAMSDDGVIEAVDDPQRPFYLGVQWHPERTPAPELGRGIFERLIAAALHRS
jgi:putative glutamine amidotransferase